MAIVVMGRKFHQPPSPFYGNTKEEWGREVGELEAVMIRC